MKNEKKGYAVGEVFRHTDGKVYQCVEYDSCRKCAFGIGEYRCSEMCCGPQSRTDGRSVGFTEVTEPSEGMLFRAENGRVYRLAKGEHSEHFCVCDTGPWLNCSELDRAVFGYVLLNDWYWSPVEEDAPAPVEPPKPVDPPKPVESPKRHIELAVVKVEGDKVTFRIVEQTHRRNDFSQQAMSRKFNSSNGIALSSFDQPCWDAAFATLFCCGNNKNKDNLEITCTAVEFAQICEAVAEYNDTDGRGYEKPWPSVGDKYFCIAAEGKVDRLTFDGYEFDRKMQGFGNFFRTKEEAKAALERVRQALKK